MFEHKYLILRDDDPAKRPLAELEVLLEEGWEPVRETPMPSSIGERTWMHPPTCLVLLSRVKGLNDEPEEIPAVIKIEWPEPPAVIDLDGMCRRSERDSDEDSQG